MISFSEQLGKTLDEDKIILNECSEGLTLAEKSLEKNHGRKKIMSFTYYPLARVFIS
jgi:hypothetical protein